MNRIELHSALLALVLSLAACAGAPPALTSDASAPVAADSGAAKDAQSPAATPAPKKSRAERKAEKAAAAATAQAGQPVVSEALVKRNADAVALLDAERYDDAVPLLEDVIAGAPALTAPRINLALAL